MSDKKPSVKKMTALRLPDDVSDKLKYIAWFDRKTFTDAMVEAMQDYAAKWEKKNGAITPDMIKKSKG